MTDLCRYLRVQAHANHAMNQRLARASAALSEAEFQAPRVSFFPSLAGTLSHLLEVDLFYVAVLEGDADARRVFDTFSPCASPADWDARQRAADQRLISFCAALNQAGCGAEVHVPRAHERVQRDRVAHLLAHLFSIRCTSTVVAP